MHSLRGPWPGSMPGHHGHRPRVAGLLGVLGLHAALLGALLLAWGGPAVMRKAQAVLQVALLPSPTSAPPAAPLLAAAPAPQPPRILQLPVPEVQVAAPPEPALRAQAAVAPVPAPVVPAARTAAPAQSAPTPPPAPARRTLASSAVQYRVMPPVELPRLSRRAGESGTVWLRVIVDRQGLPVQVLVHRSSGHPRLDEQAVWAMRQARFAPFIENGQALEIEVLAPIEYLLD